MADHKTSKSSFWVLLSPNSTNLPENTCEALCHAIIGTSSNSLFGVEFSKDPGFPLGDMVAKTTPVAYTLTTTFLPLVQAHQAGIGKVGHGLMVVIAKTMGRRNI